MTKTQELEAEIERLQKHVQLADFMVHGLKETADHAFKRWEAAEAERDALRKALEGCWCPRPANNRPDHFTVGECVAAGECGCCDGAPLMPREALSGSKKE